MKTDGQPSAILTVGYNSTIKLIKSGKAKKVFLACDCADFIRESVLSAASAADIAPDVDKTMAELGAMCGIDVGCAVCAFKKS